MIDAELFDKLTNIAREVCNRRKTMGGMQVSSALTVALDRSRSTSAGHHRRLLPGNPARPTWQRRARSRYAAQLPPVVKDPTKQAIYAFESTSWADVIDKSYNLERVYRQIDPGVLDRESLTT